jgi:hypothetical protein
MKNNRSVWVWVINRRDLPGDIFGALRRCEHAHWTDDQARAEVNNIAEEMRLGRVKWDEIDDRTWVGLTDLNYAIVVTSVLMPQGDPPR